MSHVPQQVRRFRSICLMVGCWLALSQGRHACAADALRLRHLFSASNAHGGGTFLNPQGLDYDSLRSELYVADTGNSQIVVLSRTGLPLHRYQHWVRGADGDRLIGEPGAVLALPGGKLAVTDRLSDAIDLLDFRGGVIQSIDVTAALGANERAHPGRLARDTEGNLYVVEQNTARVLIFDGRGKLLTSFGGRGQGKGRFNKIADVAVAEDGTIYVLDSLGDPAVTAFDRRGTWIHGFGRHSNKAGDFHFPVALTLDGAGRIWIADSFSHEVKAYTARGEFLATFGQMGKGQGEFYFPSDVAAFADVLYVLEKGGRRLQGFHIEGVRQLRSHAAGKEAEKDSIQRLGD